MNEHEPIKISDAGHYNLDKFNWDSFKRAADRVLERRAGITGFKKGWTPVSYGKGKENFDPKKAIKLRGRAKNYKGSKKKSK